MCERGGRLHAQPDGARPEEGVPGHAELHRGSSRNGGREREIGETIIQLRHFSRSLFVARVKVAHFEAKHFLRAVCGAIESGASEANHFPPTCLWRF